MLMNRCVQMIATFGLMMVATTTSTVFAQTEMCPEILSCKEENVSLCDRTTQKCSPCIYQMGDKYSCHPKMRGQCPFPNPIAVCDPPKVNENDDEDAGTSTSTGETESATLAPKGKAPVSATYNDAVGNNTSASSPLDTHRESIADSITSKSSESREIGSANALIASLIVGACVAALVVALFVMRHIKNKHQENEDDLKSTFQTTCLKPFNSNPLEGEEFGYNAQKTGKARTQSASSDVDSMMSMSSMSMVSSNSDFYDDDDIGDGLPSYDQYQKNQRNKHANTIDEEEEEGKFSSMQSLGQHGALPSHHQSRYDNDAGTLSYIQQNPPYSFRSSMASSMDPESDDRMTNISEYDIVDPKPMRLANERNTETLVNEGRFLFLSNASFVYAESEVDDLSVYSDSFSSPREAEF